jgi:hypothetical protein
MQERMRGGGTYPGQTNQLIHESISGRHWVDSRQIFIAHKIKGNRNPMQAEVEEN